MSNSLWPHRRQPTRLPRPWDSPGKNTGVGCHFLLQCMKVKSESEVAQSCLTLATPWTAASGAPLSMGFSRQECWSGLLLPSPSLVNYLSPNGSPYSILGIQFSIVQSISRVWLFATPWITARQDSLSFTNSWSLLKLMSIESAMPSSHLILCCPLLLLPPMHPSIMVFSNESTLHMRWPKYWSFSFNISPTNEHPGLISCRMDRWDLLEVQGTLKSLLQ